MAGRAAADNRAFRLDKYTQSLRVDLFNAARHTRESSGSARADDDGVNVPFHLLDDLSGGRLLVKARVGRVVELLRNVTVFNLFGHRLSANDCALHPLLFGDVLDFAAEGFHD